MIKISFAAALLICLTACNDMQKPVSPHRPIKTKALKYPGYESSVRTIKDNIIVYLMVVVKNKNLQPFIDDLKASPLVMSYKLDGIPSFIKSFLEALSGDHFTIANPGKEWNCCCDHDERRPNRQLICQGKDENIFLISYRTGGIAETGHIILIRFQHDRIIDFWTSPQIETLTTKDAIIKFLVAGKIDHNQSIQI